MEALHDERSEATSDPMPSHWQADVLALQEAMLHMPHIHDESARPDVFSLPLVMSYSCYVADQHDDNLLWWQELVGMEDV